jgi:hypothetical protein
MMNACATQATANIRVELIPFAQKELEGVWLLKPKLRANLGMRCARDIRVVTHRPKTELARAIVDVDIGAVIWEAPEGPRREHDESIRRIETEEEHSRFFTVDMNVGANVDLAKRTPAG